MTIKRMLIDASHPEETRVAIVSGQHLEDFDVEAESRRQLRGNVYLAKVTRVEPSLQAVFVDYGGNRHGFLAFSEIHPDYYQIPVADRNALVAEHQEAETEAGAKDFAKTEITTFDNAKSNEAKGSSVEVLGGDDEDDVQAERLTVSKRRYKIQEVVKRRQILLVQVVKEERGNKGAALTTYLSLAGRYCVLMPNTARGGGISRKIANPLDRKRLKKVLTDLKIPEVMAVIVRTAGQKRSKAEIKRDYEYLLRLWESLRELTLISIAPCLVHEEGNLIKRSIRDLYSKEIDEIIIDGDTGYRTAKDFMKLLIPSHTKRVQPFKETGKQLFQHFQVESQLDAMHSPTAQLKSGSYIVINPTEALVSIDVNSGRSTRGRNIEETALKTNLEASDEIARQLKLRDLSGLIVIDYIDMEVPRNQTKVEHRLKDAMRADRARIQIGRISLFGLLELSRQRMRPSLIEVSSDPCPHCEGTGIRRSADSAALHLFRAIKEEAMLQNGKKITVHSPTQVALHIFNNHRDIPAEIEKNYNISIIFKTDDTLISPSYRLELEGGGLEENRSHNKAKEIAEGGSKRRGRREQVSSEKNTSENTKNIYEPTEAIENFNKGVATETGQESQEETVPINSNRRRRGRRGGRRRGRKPLEQTPQDLADGQDIGVASALADDAIQGNENTSINTNTPSQNQKPIPSDNTTTIEKHIADTKTSKLEGKETKKPIKRALTKTLKKTDIKPTAKKRVGNVKSTSASSPKAISDLPPEIAPNTPPKKKPASVTSKLPEDEPKVPLPASAKTQIIQVEADDNMGDDDKKISKGWWR